MTGLRVVLLNFEDFKAEVFYCHIAWFLGVGEWDSKVLLLFLQCMYHYFAIDLLGALFSCVDHRVGVLRWPRRVKHKQKRKHK